MSEETPTPQAESAPTPADMPQKHDPGAEDDAKPVRTPEEYEEMVRKLKSENFKYRDKLREVEPLAKAAQEAEEANKTEIQKAVDRAAKAEKAAAELQEGYTRMELAVSYKINDPKQVELIGSGSREEMDARAATVAALNKAAEKASPPPTDRPVEGLRPGATPEPPKPADDSYPSGWAPSYLREDPRSQYGQ